MIKRATLIGEQAELEIADAEVSGSFSDKLRGVIHDAQMHKLLRPKRYGGFGLGPRTFSDGMIGLVSVPLLKFPVTRSVSLAW